MTPLDLILSLLPDATKSGTGWTARCPAHEDSRASLSISEGDAGRVLLRCFAGCPVDAICEAVGLKIADLFSPATTASTSTEPQQSLKKPGNCRQADAKPKGPAFASSDEAVEALERRHGPVSASWTYHDAAGEPVGIVLRWNLPDGKKDIRPVSRHADGWRIGGMPDPRPPYRLPELADADRVFVCEGEKAADAARSIGLTATTSAHGSQSAAQTDWGPLAGKVVVILPDHDAPGRQYAATVTDILLQLAPPAVVQVVDLPDLPDKGDLVEWIQAQGDTVEPAELRARVEALAEAAEPVTPVRPAPSVDRFQPFPVETLPEPLRGFVADGSQAIGCDPSYIASPLLTACGAAIGNAARIELKPGWLAPPILWTAIIGESGTAKTPAFQLVMKPVRERQHTALQRHAEAEREHQTELAWHKKKLGQWEKLTESSEEPPRKPDEPQAERLSIEDTTVEAVAPLLAGNPRGLLLARDELSGWFGSFDKYASGKGGADAAQWLSMFGAGTLTVDRKSGTPKTISVANAAMCITGGIQPGILKRALGAEHRESGMAARFLLAFPPRTAKRWTDAEIDPRQEAHYAEVLNRLYDLPLTRKADGRPFPQVVGLSPAAKAVFTAFYDSNGREQADLSGDLAAAWSKLEEYPGRLALVIHYVRWAAGDPTLESQATVDAATMSAAIRLTEWFKHEARRIYGVLSESEADRDQRQLIEWITRKGQPVTAREVQQGCRWLKGPGEAERALKSLVDAGAGTWLSSPKGQPGQPTRRFKLSTVNGIHVSPVSGGVP